MWFTPGHAPDLGAVLAWMGTLTAGSPLYAWVFERGGRSMAVAIALHMSAHLDNVTRAPEGEVRLRILRFVVLAVAAGFAARALAARPAVAVPARG